MKIYVARHGETEWNKDDRVLGRTDMPLNEKGLRQADILAERCANLGIDAIFSSPLTRARQTAGIAGKALNLPVITDERLIEVNFGVWEGARRSDETYIRMKKQFAKRYEGGESMLDVSRRIFPFFDMLKRNYADKTVLVVCHKALMRVINAYFANPDNEEFFAFAPDNCDVIEYEI